MKRLIKYGIFSVLGIALLSWLVYGDEAWSLMRSAHGRLRTEAAGAIPLELRLQQVEDALEAAEGEIREQARRSAELQVATEELEREVRTLEQRLGGHKEALASLRDAYEGTGRGAQPVAFGGRTIDPREVEQRLRIAALKTKEVARQLELKRDLLERRRTVLRRSRAHSIELRGKYERFQVLLESVRTDLDHTRMLEGGDGSDVRSSHLARAEGVLDRVSREIRVRRLAAEELDEQAGSLLPDTAGVSSAGLLREVDELLGRSTGDLGPNDG